MRAITTPYPGAFTYNSEKKNNYFKGLDFKKKFSKLKPGQVLKIIIKFLLKLEMGQYKLIVKLENLKI